MLEGTVEWQYQRKLAEEAVEGVRGVTGVVNKIEVWPMSRRSRSSDVGIASQRVLDVALDIGIQSHGGSSSTRTATRSALGPARQP